MTKQYINPGTLKFTAVIERNGGVDNSSAYIVFPYDLKETYGVGNLVPVNVLLDGKVPYQGSLAKMGGPPLIVLRKDIRAMLGKQPGDSVAVKVELDDKPRVVAVAPDIQKALISSGQADYFESLAYTHRREYIKWIEEAKRPETRVNRIQKMTELLVDKNKDHS